MIAGKPYRSVPTALLFVLLAVTKMFAAGPEFPRTPAKTQRTFQLEQQSSQQAVFSRNGFWTIGHHTQTRPQHCLPAAVVPAHWSAARSDGRYCVAPAARLRSGRHVPSGSGRSPPLSFL
jgi:hypothetical protein